MSRLLKSFGSLTDRIICVLFAVLFAQVPVYISQYIDVLSGARMEAQKVYDDVAEVANAYQQSVDQFLEDMTNHPDQKVRDMSSVQLNTVQRYHRYTEALEALTERAAWLKPFYLIRHYDPSIHASMFFEPNVPLTIEGAIYALMGLIVALLLIGLVTGIVQRVRNSRKKEESLYRSVS
ncbi:MAG: DUF2937 family protein [Bacteroidota bacterium]